MPKYSWRMLFEDFKRTYPDKWKKGTSYEPAGFMSIIVRIPEDGKYKYDYFEKKLTLIERYLTYRQQKYLRQFEREEKVRNIFEIMKEHKITQTKLSRLSGISRESLNRYKNGSLTPKYSTLEKIQNAIEDYLNNN